MFQAYTASTGGMGSSSDERRAARLVFFGFYNNSTTRGFSIWTLVQDLRHSRTRQELALDIPSNCRRSALLTSGYGNRRLQQAPTTPDCLPFRGSDEGCLPDWAYMPHLIVLDVSGYPFRLVFILSDVPFVGFDKMAKSGSDFRLYRLVSFAGFRVLVYYKDWHVTSSRGQYKGTSKSNSCSVL